MAASKLLPPLRPMAAMAGTPRRWQTSIRRSLLSTTLTKPTGTPMTRAGRKSPRSMASQRAKRAVGALPTAKTAPQPGQGGLAHPGQGHIGVGDDGPAGRQGGRPPGRGAGGEAEAGRVVEIGGGMD